MTMLTDTTTTINTVTEATTTVMGTMETMPLLDLMDHHHAHRNPTVHVVRPWNPRMTLVIYTMGDRPMDRMVAAALRRDLPRAGIA